MRVYHLRGAFQAPQPLTPPTMTRMKTRVADARQIIHYFYSRHRAAAPHKVIVVCAEKFIMLYRGQ